VAGGPTSDAALVEELFLAAYDDWPADAYRLLAPDYIARTFTGHVFYGQVGYAQWYLAQAREYRGREFAPDELAELGAGYVLITGSVRLTRHDGEIEVQPGAWVNRVRGGRVVATTFFRTRAEAVAAVDGAQD
jgi:hypothetical protein